MNCIEKILKYLIIKDRTMKTKFKLLLLLIFINLTVFSQTRNSVTRHRTRVQLKKVNQAEENEKLLSIDDRGNIEWLSKSNLSSLPQTLQLTGNRLSISDGNTVQLVDLVDVPNYQAGTNINIDSSNPENPIISTLDVIPYTGASQNIDINNKSITSTDIIDDKGIINTYTSTIRPDLISNKINYSNNSIVETVFSEGLIQSTFNNGISTQGSYLGSSSLNISFNNQNVINLQAALNSNDASLTLGTNGISEKISVLDNEKLTLYGNQFINGVSLDADTSINGFFTATLQPKDGTVALLSDIPNIQVTFTKDFNYDSVNNPIPDSIEQTLLYEPTSTQYISVKSIKAIINGASGSSPLSNAYFYYEGTDPFTFTNVDATLGSSNGGLEVQSSTATDLENAPNIVKQGKSLRAWLIDGSSGQPYNIKITIEFTVENI